MDLQLGKKLDVITETDKLIERYACQILHSNLDKLAQGSYEITTLSCNMREKHFK